MAVVAILGCGQPRSGAVPQAAEQASFEEAERGLSPAIDRIAYVNPGGELFIVNPDGSDPIQLTGAERAGQRPVGLLAQVLAPNEVHAWPTWAPDGSKIAVSRVVVGENTAEVSVLSIDVNSAQTTVVFRNESPSLVADGAPHYLYWSPDSRRLAFLVGGQSGLVLYVWDSGLGKRGPGGDRSAFVFPLEPVRGNLGLARGPGGPSGEPSCRARHDGRLRTIPSADVSRRFPPTVRIWRTW